MQKITVHASKSYDVCICGDHSAFPQGLYAGRKVALVSDDIVYPLYGEKVRALFPQSETFPFVFPAGESSKRAETCLAALSFLAQNGFSRKDAVVALGGGVVGDLAGFVASTYMRGVSLYQIPTTLLAMIDSSVGGKTAIDLPEGKNLVGTFYQPDGVYIDLSAQHTLPEKERVNGFGELIKYAFLSREVRKEDLVFPATEKVVSACVKIKADIVAADEKEGGKRMLLNLGHTVGHAIELLSGYTLPHGLCVLKGLSAAIGISQKLYGFSKETEKEMRELLFSAGAAGKVDFSLPFAKEEIVRAIFHDKKAAGSTVNFVTIRKIGDCEIVRLPIAEIEKLL